MWATRWRQPRLAERPIARSRSNRSVHTQEHPRPQPRSGSSSSQFSCPRSRHVADDCSGSPDVSADELLVIVRRIDIGHDTWIIDVHIDNAVLMGAKHG